MEEFIVKAVTSKPALAYKGFGKKYSSYVDATKVNLKAKEPK